MDQFSSFSTSPPKKTSNQSTWSVEEDTRLMKLVKVNKSRNWKKIADMIKVIIIISAMKLILMLASYFVLRKNINKNM